MLTKATMMEVEVKNAPSLMFVCTECECPVDYEWVTEQYVVLDMCEWNCDAPLMMQYTQEVSE